MLWDYRRPFIPFASFAEHNDDVTGMSYILSVCVCVCVCVRVCEKEPHTVGKLKLFCYPVLGLSSALNNRKGVFTPFHEDNFCEKSGLF